AIYSEEHFGPPARMAGICTDEKGYFETIEFLREYAKKHDVRILYGHDMKQFRSLKKTYV
ncbi:MAG: N-acyl homoserine lactonase family protein, partial [Firmicutes bacterium]|nr:N-acyl homoserine lactonase family protein [Bacillota bacterium]